MRTTIEVARRITDAVMFSERYKRLLTNAIMNYHPLVYVSSDPDSPCIESSTSLLILRVAVLMIFFQTRLSRHIRQSMEIPSISSKQFPCRWKQEYLHSLQTRQKWQSTHDITKKDDVLLKDSCVSWT